MQITPCCLVMAPVMILLPTSASQDGGVIERVNESCFHWNWGNVTGNPPDKRRNRCRCVLFGWIYYLTFIISFWSVLDLRHSLIFYHTHTHIRLKEQQAKLQMCCTTQKTYWHDALLTINSNYDEFLGSALYWTQNLASFLFSRFAEPRCSSGYTLYCAIYTLTDWSRSDRLVHLDWVY